MASLYERVVLQEGIFDRHILKAIFTGGGMGSGKSAVAGWAFGASGAAFGLKILSVDEIFELRAKQLGLDTKTAFNVPTQNPDFASRGHEVHDASWYTMMNQRSHFSRGRLGLLIDGTAKDPAYILRGKKALEDLGYDCSMVMVTTPLDTARARNQSRGRSVTDADLKASHDAIRRAGDVYKKKFGKRYYEIENSSSYDTASNEFRAEVEPNFHRLAMKILGKPLTNPKGKAWVTQQLEGAPPHLRRRSGRVSAFAGARAQWTSSVPWGGGRSRRQEQLREEEAPHGQSPVRRGHQGDEVGRQAAWVDSGQRRDGQVHR